MLKKTVSQLYFACMYYIVFSWIKYQKGKKKPTTQPQALPATKAFDGSIFNFVAAEKTSLG